MKKLFLLFTLFAVFLSGCSSTKGPKPKPPQVTIGIKISGDNSIDFANINMNTFLFDVRRELDNFQYVDLVYVDPEDKPRVLLDISIENFYIDPKNESTSRRTYSARVQSGTDAAGKPVYQTVTATADITETIIPARANLAYRLTFKDNPPKTAQNRYYENYKWQNISVGNIQGDSRAIDPSIYSYQRMEIEPYSDQILLILAKREMLRRISDELRKYYPKPKT